MRLYETSDVSFYVNVRNGWDSYCRYGPKKSWFQKPSTQTPLKVMKCYGDLEGRSKARIENKDLYFQCWPEARIKPKACLPMLYSVGNRFIKLEHEKPINFRCSAFPMNLKEVRERKKRMKEERLAKKHQKWLAQMLLQECQKRKKPSRSAKVK